ncbi:MULTISPECIES: hypothetical protein [Arthrobacter]|uniref:hypothetical protein n=1 Tax=Arthrobacter TaxID=1663 RepID=UPI0014759AA5|nr:MULTISPECIES: hypothetical protein [Arthrobacter]NYG19235.1 NADH:ubiquinone oxidoreductase subunit 4 (subunit M) [Arthrobacter psychrochitiniphilus]
MSAKWSRANAANMNSGAGRIALIAIVLMVAGVGIIRLVLGLGPSKTGLPSK